MEKVTSKQIYNRLSKVYDRSYDEPVHKIEDDYIYKFISDKGFTEGKILDLGCGTGTLLKNIAILPENYIGLDIADKMIGICQEKFPNNVFIIGDMSNIPNKEGSFDNVISLFGSYSYSNDHHKTTEEIKRVLKPKGKFLLMVCGIKYKSRKSYILNKFNIDSPARFFKKKELKLLFKDFDNVKIFGMTMLSEELSKHFPFSISKAYHFVETNILGSIIPNKFYFLIITGNKHA
jgi:ubiquinone/menaquinone biosynthesis C-methylase UbiE